MRGSDPSGSDTPAHAGAANHLQYIELSGFNSITRASIFGPFPSVMTERNLNQLRLFEEITDI